MGDTSRNYRRANVPFAAGNITEVADNAFRPGSDHRTKYTHDGLYRLKKAEEGNGAGSNFTASYGTEDWAPSINSVSKPLSQTGNWNGIKRADTAWGVTARELVGSFNRVNEMTLWAGLDNGATVSYGPTYSANGEQTDDARRFTFKYDGWGRLVEVKNKASTPLTIAQYKYNGLGYRTGWKYNITGTNGFGTDDAWLWFVYNERWQQIAAYRVGNSSPFAWSDAANANPKEIITHHAAGVAGSGNASYIDAVIMRDRDNAAWNAAAKSGTGANARAIEYSEFVLQNWRADVVRTLRTTANGGAMGAQIRYTAYGEPASFSIYDIAGGGSGLNGPDGNIDGEDYSAFLSAFAAEEVLADIVGGDGNPPGDGNVDGSDFAAFMNAYGAGAGLVGPGVLSSEGDAGLRRGYAGYECDPVLGLIGASVYHVRNRVYDAENGRWTERDPLGYVDGPSMYEYCRGMAMEALDPSGLAKICRRPLDGGGIVYQPSVPMRTVGETVWNLRCFSWNERLFGGLLWLYSFPAERQERWNEKWLTPNQNGLFHEHICYEDFLLPSDSGYFEDGVGSDPRSCKGDCVGGYSDAIMRKCEEACQAAGSCKATDYNVWFNNCQHYVDCVRRCHDGEQIGPSMIPLGPPPLRPGDAWAGVK